MNSAFITRCRALYRLLKGKALGHDPTFQAQYRLPATPRAVSSTPAAAGSRLAVSAIRLGIGLFGLALVLLLIIGSTTVGDKDAPPISVDAQRSGLAGFAGEVRMGDDGTLSVTEMFPLTVVSGPAFHSIVRMLPRSFQDRNGESRPLAYSDVRAFRDGHDEPFIIEDGEVRFIKIGSAEALLEPGSYQYGLQYKLGGTITEEGTREEMHLFVLGDWDYIVPSLKFSVRLPKRLAPEAVQAALVKVNPFVFDPETRSVTLGAEDVQQEVQLLNDDPSFSAAIVFTLTKPFEARHILRLDLSWPAVGLTKRAK